MYIYIITNNVNKKQYVGQSINDPEASNGRIKAHLSLHCKGCTNIYNAIKKYGPESFSYEAIHYPGASQEALDAIEQWKIKSLNTLSPNGYNLDTGGNGRGIPSKETRQKMSKNNSGENNGMYGKKITEEHKKILSKTNKGENNAFYGKKHTKETLEKMSKNRKGKKHTEETIELLRKKNKGENNGMYGKKHTKETKQKISQANKGKTSPMKGKKLSEESKQKISQANKGKKRSEEQKQKISQANKGKKRSEETRKKISESNKKAWVKRKLNNAPK